MATLTTSYQQLAEKKLGNSGYGDVYVRLYAKYNSQSIADNTSNVSIQARIYTEGAYWYSSTGTTYKITGSGSIDSGNVGCNGRYDVGEKTLGTQTKDIKHNTDGSLTISASANFTSQPWGWNGTASSSDITLPKIPRYATSNQSFNSKTESSITMNWSSDSTIDYVWYSTDNGSTWTERDVTDGTSGSYTIWEKSNDGKSLSANTTYNIKTRVRRKDSQLTTDSSALSVTTYDFPYCTESPNFTIGNSLTLKFYNPLGRTIQVYFLDAKGSAVDAGTTNGTTMTGFYSGNFTNWLYSTIPNAKSGKYQVKVVYGSSEKTRNNGNTYSIKGTETPTVGSITYEDTNSTVTEITGDNQYIVQNKSNLKVNYTKATGNNSASISKYVFTLNGVTKESTSAGGTIDFGKVNSATYLNLTMKVIDSRGLTSSTTKTIKMVEHSNPNAIVTLERLNNYEDESYLTVDASISSVNNKNTMTIKYRYKVSGGSYGDYTTINDNEKQTLNLDKTNAYIFNVVITDAFGSSLNKEYALGKGVFPLFIDIEKNSVGINCFPEREESLEVNGEPIRDGMIVSPTEPTTGEKVWVQKSHNLLNVSETLSITRTSGDIPCYLKTGTYTISADEISSSGGSYESYLGFKNSKGETIKYTYLYYADKKLTFDLSEDAVAIVLWSQKYWDISQGVTTTFKKLQIVAGGNRLPYSKYIGKKILARNDNGVYEEIFDENNLHKYSTNERIAGTWIDGRPIYEKTITTTFKNEYQENNKYYCWVPYDEPNFDILVDLRLTAKGTDRQISTSADQSNLTGVIRNSAVQVGATEGQFAVGVPLYIIIQYTKTTD